MSAAVEKYSPPISEIQTWAEKFAESGMFTDARQVMQAFVKISAGAELGLTPFQSMTGVHIIQGKPVVGAGLLASLLDRDPAYDYTVEWEPNEANPQACTVVVIKNDKERGRSRFSLEDAKRAGLSGGNWQKYPASMLFARAMSNAVRWYAPGATGTSVYVEGELDPTPPQHADKPRVTATVQRMHDPVEVVADADVELVDGLPVEPVSLPDVKAQIMNLSVQERADLYDLASIPKGTRAPDVKALLIAKADAINLPHSDPPDVHAILSRLRTLSRDDASAEAFQRFIDTGEDLDAGDQATIDGEVLA